MRRDGNTEVTEIGAQRAQRKERRKEKAYAADAEIGRERRRRRNPRAQTGVSVPKARAAASEGGRYKGRNETQEQGSFAIRGKQV